jgi:hypothetical protein
MRGHIVLSSTEEHFVFVRGDMYLLPMLFFPGRDYSHLYKLHFARCMEIESMCDSVHNLENMMVTRKFIVCNIYTKSDVHEYLAKKLCLMEDDDITGINIYDKKRRRSGDALLSEAPMIMKKN